MSATFQDNSDMKSKKKRCPPNYSEKAAQKSHPANHSSAKSQLQKEALLDPDTPGNHIFVDVLDKFSQPGKENVFRRQIGHKKRFQPSQSVYLRQRSTDSESLEWHDQLELAEHQEHDEQPVLDELTAPVVVLTQHTKTRRIKSGRRSQHNPNEVAYQVSSLIDLDPVVDQTEDTSYNVFPADQLVPHFFAILSVSWDQLGSDLRQLADRFHVHGTDCRHFLVDLQAQGRGKLCFLSFTRLGSGCSPATSAFLIQLHVSHSQKIVDKHGESEWRRIFMLDSDKMRPVTSPLQLVDRLLISKLVNSIHNDDHSGQQDDFSRPLHICKRVQLTFRDLQFGCRYQAQVEAQLSSQQLFKCHPEWRLSGRLTSEVVAASPPASLIPTTCPTECPICFCELQWELDNCCEDWPGTQLGGLATTLPGCSHTFCRDCLYTHCRSSVLNTRIRQAAVPCPMPRCPGLVGAVHVISALPNEISQFSRHLQLLALDWCGRMQADHRLSVCPRDSCATFLAVESTAEDKEDFPVIQAGSEFHCRCGTVFCSDCAASPSHWPSSCRQNAWYTSFGQRLGDRDLRRVNQIHLNTRVDGRKCPGCLYFIEKDGGCPHMHCTRCGCDFCWTCGKKYDNGCCSACVVTDTDRHVLTGNLLEIGRRPVFYRDAVMARLHGNEVLALLRTSKLARLTQRIDKRELSDAVNLIKQVQEYMHLLQVDIESQQEQPSVKEKMRARMMKFISVNFNFFVNQANQNLEIALRHHKSKPLEMHEKKQFDQKLDKAMEYLKLAISLSRRMKSVDLVSS